MAIVLDASITAAWAFPDEDHPVARRVFERIENDDAWAPSLWWFEMRNILVVNERRRRIAPADSDAFLRSLARLPILIDRDPNEGVVLLLARRHGLSVYDSAYLELAQRKALPLATLDAALGKAAGKEKIPLTGANPRGK